MPSTARYGFERTVNTDIDNVLLVDLDLTSMGVNASLVLGCSCALWCPKTASVDDDSTDRNS